jgi:hypothetical protein
MSVNTHTTLQTSAQVISAIANYCKRSERNGIGWKCECPICGRHSLSVTHKLLKLVYCHHCASNGINDGHTEQRKIFIKAGLLPADDSLVEKPSPKEIEEFNKERLRIATEHWDSLIPIRQGYQAANYLHARGIDNFIGHRALRCSSAMIHPEGFFRPVLGARFIHVQQGFCGVQLTYLKGDGSDRERLLEPPRMTYGPIKGGAVWIGRPQLHEEMVVAEGLETCLSAMLLLNLKCGAAMCGPHMKDLVFPRSVRKVLIAADNDETGRGAAECAANMWRNRGLKVRISYPETVGKDFNDVLMGRMS